MRTTPFLSAAPWLFLALLAACGPGESAGRTRPEVPLPDASLRDQRDAGGIEDIHPGPIGPGPYTETERRLAQTGPGAELSEAVNALRRSLGLAEIPVSLALTRVAWAHVVDLAERGPDSTSSCGLGSWSDAGPWSPCCDRADVASASCMWDKPSELAGYAGRGFELSARTDARTFEEILDLWVDSPDHAALLYSRGEWSSPPWKAMGAAVYGGFAVIWLGTEPDPEPLEGSGT